MSRQGVMLAGVFNPRLIEKRWGDSFYLQPKINGLRCRAKIVNREATLYSSEGNIITTVPHINERLTECRVDLEVDGELFIKDVDLGHICSVVKRGDLHPEYESVEYRVFDTISNLPQFARMGELKYVPHFGCVKHVETMYVELSDVDNLLESYTREGYEGVILRDPNAYYVPKRTSSLQKIKMSEVDTYQIVDTKQEQEIGGAYKDSLGSFTCQTEGGEVFSVGSGPVLTRDMRTTLWRDRVSLVGQFLLVKYLELTPRGVPRHPVAMELLSVDNH